MKSSSVFFSLHPRRCLRVAYLIAHFELYYIDADDTAILWRKKDDSETKET